MWKVTLYLTWITLLLCVIRFGLADFDNNAIYVGCNQKTRFCYGTPDGCVQTKNCTFVLAGFEDETHINAEIQNNCNIQLYNVFFGIGVHALNKNKTTHQSEYKCTPKLKDLKFFILWEGELCAKHGIFQKKWGQLKKVGLPPCETSPPVDNLLEFVQNRMLVHAGNIPITLIENKTYIDEDGGVFFTNSGNSIGPTLKFTSTIIFIWISYTLL